MIEGFVTILEVEDSVGVIDLSIIQLRMLTMNSNIKWHLYKLIESCERQCSSLA